MALTRERLKELLSYDPESGSWTWLVSRGRVKAGSIAHHLDKDGYVIIVIDKRPYRSCRLAFLFMKGVWPSEKVDHKDGKPSNDRWANLREAAHSQNMANSGAYITNSLGLKGVSRGSRSKLNPYRAKIIVNGRYIHLGLFPTKESAHAAYAAAAERHFGEFARVA